MSDDADKPVEEEKIVAPPGGATPEAVDPTLPLKALDLMKGTLKGNGVRPENVELHGFTGHILNFIAFETFKMEVRTGEKTVAGKQQGELFGSRHEVRQRLQQVVEKITLDKTVQKSTVELLKKRPDLGFGIDGFGMNLDRMGRSFVAHETCTACSGTAKDVCKQCAGTGKLSCPRCHRTREISCPHCHGMKWMPGTNGKQEPCRQCHGHGKIPCVHCRRQGHIACTKCKSAGNIPCQPCAGTGFVSFILRMEVKAKSRFEFDRSVLPEGVAALIDSYRDRLVTEKHAAVHIIEDQHLMEQLDKTSRPDEYMIPYGVRLPWGEIDFSASTVNGVTNILGKMFGFNPVLVSMPPFLEETAFRGLHELAAAAQGTGRNPGASLREAARVRIAAECILATLKNGPAKAAAMLHKRYPFGIRPEVLTAATKNVAEAISRVTRTARGIGCAGGITLVALLQALYFMGPPRRMMAVIAGPGSPVPVALDAALAILSVLIVAAATQYAAASAVKKALGPVLRQEKNGALRPASGLVWLWALAGGLGSYAAILALTALRGEPLPPWCETLRALIGL